MFRRFLVMILLLLGWSQNMWAHQVQSVEFEFQKTDKQWRLVGSMDIAYMLPETRKLLGMGPLSREAVMKAPPEELARIRRETEKTLRNLLRLQFAGKDVAWRIEFPDFEKQPFTLPEEAADWALLTTRLVIDARPGPGELSVHWSGEEEAELIILTEDGGNEDILSVLPGGDIALLKVAAPPPVAAGAAQSESEGAPAPQTETIRHNEFLRWMKTGYFHVVPVGMDHILFILGLFLMRPKLRPLLKQSLMFTVAHSVTLMLSALGWVDVPARLLQILIALTIAYIGVENLFAHKVGKWRMTVVLVFGLIHGVGFAGGLADSLRGVPRSELTAPLLGFNVGVELAQISVLLAASVLIWPLRRWTRQVQLYGSIVVGLAGTAWMIERILA